MTGDSYIDNTAKIGIDCNFGHNIIILANAEIGNEVIIGNNVVIHRGTKIGDRVIIQDNSVLGRQPKPSPLSTVKITKELPPLIIGSGTTIGTSVVLYAGTEIGQNAMIADLSSIRERCKIGNYVVVGRGVAVENETIIGDYTKIQTGAYIVAYMTIEDHVFIAPMVVALNDNFMGRTEKRFALRKGPYIKRGARIGGGAILLPGVTIGEEAFIAAGSVVTKDVPNKKLVMGIPARVVRDVPEEEMLDR